MSSQDVDVAKPLARPAGFRAVPVLVEHDVQHYPDFARFLSATFALDRDPLGQPGLIVVGGDRFYELVFVGRSGRPFPAGVEVNALVEGVEPLDAEQADRDLWDILGWLVAGASGGGGDWTVEALAETGRLYRIPAAG